MNDLKMLFGINDWSVEFCPDNGRPLYRCTHKSFGEFFCFDSFLNPQRAETSESYKFLSLIWEYSLKGQKVVLLTESEARSDSAQEYRRNVSPDILVYSVDEYLTKFPRNIVEKQNRILMILYRIHSTPGEIVNLLDKEPWRYFSENQEEMAFLFQCMKEKGWLDVDLQYSGTGYRGYRGDAKSPRIAQNGWIQIEKNLEPIRITRITGSELK